MKITRKIFLKTIDYFVVAIWFAIGIWGISVMFAGMATDQSFGFAIGFFLYIIAFIIKNLEERFILPKLREEGK